MKPRLINIDGKEIDLSSLTDEELMELHKEVKTRERKYKKTIQKYKEKYTFLTQN